MMTAYVVQDCVETGGSDDYHFRCDAQVALTLERAKEKARDAFRRRFRQLAGHVPSHELEAALADSMDDQTSRVYTVDVTEGATLTVEILERGLV